MPRVGAIILSAAIVENGKQLDDKLVRPGMFRDPVPVLPHPRPVPDPVNAAQIEDEPILRDLQDLVDVGDGGGGGHGGCSCADATSWLDWHRREDSWPSPRFGQEAVIAFLLA